MRVIPHLCFNGQCRDANALSSTAPIYCRRTTSSRRAFFVPLGVGDAARAHQIFLELAEGGTVGLPFQGTFWSPGFGVVVDRFGMPWEINSVEPNVEPHDQNSR